uniref:PDZ domain-containing protein n=1 Tax=Mesocestoides corti TaxID=53468 RepID=A0A5K3FPD0_MESCO
RFLIYFFTFHGGRKGTGPFSVEIEKLPTEKFGADLVAFGDSAHGYRRLLISHIRDGSIADRCGVLEVGDLIESINDRRSTDLTLHEAMDLLESTTAKSIKLCVLPSPESGIDFSGTCGLTTRSLATPKCDTNHCTLCSAPTVIRLVAPEIRPITAKKN